MGTSQHGYVTDDCMSYAKGYFHPPDATSCSHSRSKCSWGSLEGSSKGEPTGTCSATAAADRGRGEKAAGESVPLGSLILPLQCITQMFSLIETHLSLSLKTCGMQSTSSCSSS